MSNTPNQHKKKWEPSCRLMINISYTVPDIKAGEELYDLIKNQHKDDPGIQISGQIMRFLEPCCGEKR